MPAVKFTKRQLLDLREKGLSNSEIARQLGVHKSNITRRLRSLDVKASSIIHHGSNQDKLIPPLSLNVEYIRKAEKIIEMVHSQLSRLNEVIERNSQSIPIRKYPPGKRDSTIQRDNIILEAIKLSNQAFHEIPAINDFVQKSGAYNAFMNIMLDQMGEEDQGLRDRIYNRLKAIVDRYHTRRKQRHFQERDG